MNEVLIVNPRRRATRNRKGQFVKRVSAGGRARRRNPVAALAVNPRRRRRRNPLALLANPKKKKRRGKWFSVKAHQRNPISHRRRRRNPVSLAAFRPQSIMAQLIPAAIGGAGALALDVALSHIPQPDFLNNAYGKLAIRVFGAVGIGMLAGLVKSNIGRQVTAGALTVVAYNTIRDVVQKVAPQITMGGYMEDSMGYIDPAPRLEGQGMGAYMRASTGAPAMAGMGAYMQPDTSSMGNYGDGM